MVRRFAIVILVASVTMLPLPSTAGVSGQESGAACASALWLEPLAAEAAADATAAAEIAESSRAWLTAELTDACSGATFALADFAGKTLFVEPMATWCTTCRGQLTRLTEAAAQIPAAERQDIVLVALSSEVDLPREYLAAYAADAGFPFIFAVMPAEMLRSMADDLGQEVAVPPATPHLIVAPDGTVGDLRTGFASADDLLALLRGAAAEDAAAS